MITPNEDICVIDFNTSLVFSKGVLAIGATPGYAAPDVYKRQIQPDFQRGVSVFLQLLIGSQGIFLIAGIPGRFRLTNICGRQMCIRDRR